MTCECRRPRDPARHRSHGERRRGPCYEGPKGSGKSTLAQVLAGREDSDITGGEVLDEGNDRLQRSPEARARAGIVWAFQSPVAIPGVSTTDVLRAAVNASRTHRGLEELDVMDCLGLLKDTMNLVEMDQTWLNRSMNEGCSGGEKKRHEILQMAVLDPTLAILDDTDAGLDIEALRIGATGINGLRRPARALIIMTHDQRVLKDMVPDVLHVLFEGRLVTSGDKQLALELEQKGYRFSSVQTLKLFSVLGPNVLLITTSAASLLGPNVQGEGWHALFAPSLSTVMLGEDADTIHPFL